VFRSHPTQSAMSCHRSWVSLSDSPQVQPPSTLDQFICCRRRCRNKSLAVCCGLRCSRVGKRNRGLRNLVAPRGHQQPNDVAPVKQAKSN
jgi:hypothetical protein